MPAARISTLVVAWTLFATSLCAQTPTLILRDVSLVDVATGKVIPHQTVMVSGDRILAVQPSSQAPAPSAQATVVDGRGLFVMPGLWDSHVHLTKLGPAALPVFLAHGITSVRDMGSDLGEVRRWRDEIAAGQRPGPRIRTSGQILETRANVERMKREATVEPVDRLRIPVGGPADAEAIVARLVGDGADFIKVRSVQDEDTLRAIANAARAHGVKWTGHPVASPDVLVTLRIGSVEHLLTFPPLTVPAPARQQLFRRMQQAEVFMGTTTVNIDGSILVPYGEAKQRLLSDPLRRFVSPYLASDWREQVEELNNPDAAAMLSSYRAALPDLYRDFREMHQAGVAFLAGSDAAVVFMYPGSSLHGELESLVRHVGLSPAEALRAATVNPARFFGLEKELGAVAPGYRADLVVLKGNPLDDVRRSRLIVGVVQAGRWLDRATLDRLLVVAAEQAQRP